MQLPRPLSAHGLNTSVAAVEEGEVLVLRITNHNFPGLKKKKENKKIKKGVIKNK